MGDIHVLPDSVVNQIAAGEIIERPVSIVKELVENSLDAGATVIKIDIERGGKQLIRVTDDGKGMSEQDAELAFERHATSKISTSDDLHQIGTMGFRGEALASIAAVSQVTLRTRCADQEAGISLFLVNGRLQNKQPIAMPTGTTLEARNLFYNTPARKKFLKSDHVEAGTITHIMNAFALAYPEISFSYTNDGREILNCPKSAALRDRFFQVFGAELLENVLELDETLFHYRLRGFVSSPDSLKTSRNYQYFFINRRYVKDKVLSNSVYVAYRVFAQTGQYPVAFLFLDMPPAMVDVNVHPAKYEVRFLQQVLVQKGIIDSIQKVLNSSRPLPSFQLQSEGNVPRYSSPDLKLSSWQQQPTENSNPFGETPQGLPMQMPAPATRKMPSPGEYKIIGQYDHTYIVMSDESGLILIDQHVAHERVLYERILEEQENRQIRTQALLIPLILDVNPAQMMLLEEYMDRFRQIGIEMEIFGNNTVAVKEIPELLLDSNYSNAVQRLLNEMERLYRDGLLESFADEMRKSMACQAAVKINMPLTREKMEYLVEELLRTNTPQVCPHGRPIILRISHYEIAKNFKRI